ncbi:OmpA family protein [Bordetella genomosp. 5]|uniref:OmpA family protein n=1 Tax=Bordetella genomosp. 5 TaxID=1395608 RepID=UPI00113FD09E|nr:OmpA family protein [Bordetella genomosp. 5]
MSLAISSTLADRIEAARKRQEAQERERAGKIARAAGTARFERWHVPEDQDHESEGWLLTYLDLITLLLALFVVLLAVARMSGSPLTPTPTEITLVGSVDAALGAPMPAAGTEPGAGQAQRWIGLPAIAEDQPFLVFDAYAPAAPVAPVAAEPEPTEPALVLPTKDQLGLDDLGKSIDVIVNDKTISFRISNELLFPSGQATLSPGGLDVIKKVAEVLNRSAYPVSVEGHSDNVPIQTRQFPSNWELSSSRATSVLRELVRDGVDGGRLRAVGYADTRPLEQGNAPAARAANRRVELIMEITPPAKPVEGTPPGAVAPAAAAVGPSAAAAPAAAAPAAAAPAAAAPAAAAPAAAAPAEPAAVAQPVSDTVSSPLPATAR